MSLILLLSLGGCSLPGNYVRPTAPRHHSKQWKAGMGVTLGGVLLSALGAGLTVAGLSDGGLGTCDITEGQRCSARPSGAALFGIGVALSAVGDVSMLAVGPALWINGARQRPEEAR